MDRVFSEGDAVSESRSRPETPRVRALDERDSKFNQKAQFTLCGLYGYNATSFRLFDSKAPLTWTTIRDSQYSTNPLFGTEPFSVGGIGSVRGFKDTWASGDSRVSLQNDVKFRVHNLLSALGPGEPVAPSPVKDMDVTLFYDVDMSCCGRRKAALSTSTWICNSTAPWVGPIPSSRNGFPIRISSPT